jgi:hypothetical protein
MNNEQLVMAVDVNLEFYDSLGNIVGTESTVTDLIMPKGARVLTTRNIQAGMTLNIRTADGKFASSAVVKDVQVGGDRIPRLTLEFTGTSWQRNWLFPADGEMPEHYYEELLERTKESSMLLHIIIADLESGHSPDQLFLSELKSSVDELRNIIFRIQKNL